MPKKANIIKSTVPFIVPPAALIPEPVLTLEQLADRLQLKPSTVYELTRKRLNGRPPMPRLRAGKFLRFYFSEVESWMREGRKVAA
jgi:excisionase family DNA binding protein